MKINALLKRLCAALTLVGGLAIGAAQAATTYWTFTSSGNVVYTRGGINNTYSLTENLSSADNGTTFTALSGNITVGGSAGSSSGATSGGFFLGSASAPNFFQVSAATSPTSFWQFTGFNIVSYTATVTETYGAPYNPSGTNNYSLTQNGAPEIDGSLAPKVSFLLGCLFLIFGRKKQNTEPMMMA